MKFWIWSYAVLVGVVGWMTLQSQSTSSDNAKPKVSEEILNRSKKATFGGGCFWCTEAMLEGIDGIIDVVSGYSGGHVENPTYKHVCEGTTGHAEVVQVTFDPETISYERLLEMFWRSHDPTTLNRQGADVGTQYRSTILWHDEDQKKVAEVSMKEAAGLFKDPIVTKLEKFEIFYPAEDYHQDYFAKNPRAGYCVFVIKPKLKKFKDYLKK